MKALNRAGTAASDMDETSFRASAATRFTVRHLDFPTSSDKV